MVARSSSPAACIQKPGWKGDFLKTFKCIYATGVLEDTFFMPLWSSLLPVKHWAASPQTLIVLLAITCTTTYCREKKGGSAGSVPVWKWHYWTQLTLRELHQWSQWTILCKARQPSPPEWFPSHKGSLLQFFVLTGGVPLPARKK